MRWPEAVAWVVLILCVTGCTTSCIVTSPRVGLEASK